MLFADMIQPLVTCVCPTTASREKWFPQMLECFLSQTYPNREILIATDETERVGEIHVNDLSVRVLFSAGLKLGAKRNFLCEHARGEIIAHFDDDDWSHPGRLMQQVARLEATGLALTGYSQLKFTDGLNWWQYADPEFPLGTSLMFRRSWWQENKFLDQIQVGSDTVLIWAAQKQGQADVIPCGDMMFARVHQENLNLRSYVPPSFVPCAPVLEYMCA